MKRLLITPLLLGLFNFSYLKAEIRNKVIISNMFNACVEQEDYPKGIGYQYSYCGCFVNKVSKGMNTKELVEFNLNIQSEKNTDKQAKLLLANEKITNYIVECVSSSIEE